MRKATLSLPGKTFLAGEYLALVGGPAFIVCTEPRFQLLVTEGNSSGNPFHPQSPAGKLWDKNADTLSRYQIQFIDPYQGLGGFGASSTQFGLLHSLLQMGDQVFGESQPDLDWHETLKEYRLLAKEEKSLPPSGADIVGVLLGGIAFFDRNSGHTQRFGWPFQDLQFSIFHTGQKLATHEHLRDLKIFETKHYQAASMQVLKGLSLVQSDTFMSGLKAYRDELVAQQKITPFSQNVVNEFEKLPAVQMAKGCGAMGSDVILVIHQGHLVDVKALGVKLGLQYIAGEKNLSSGLQTQNDHSSAISPLTEIQP